MTLHRGKIARNPTILNVRALTRDDLMVLREERHGGKDRSGNGVIDRLRDPHHRLARLIAAGLRLNDAAERAGFSYNRACTLNKDPSFVELVASYRDKVDASWVREQDQFHEQNLRVMAKANTQLEQKLDEADENGEFLPTRDLIAITSDRMDRFGYGKRQTNLNVNVDFASMLEKARARSSAPRQIEASPVAPVLPQYPQSPLVPAQASSGGNYPPQDDGAVAPKLLRRI